MTFPKILKLDGLVGFGIKMQFTRMVLKSKLTIVNSTSNILKLCSRSIQKSK